MDFDLQRFASGTVTIKGDESGTVYLDGVSYTVSTLSADQITVTASDGSAVNVETVDEPGAYVFTIGDDRYTVSVNDGVYSINGGAATLAGYDTVVISGDGNYTVNATDTIGVDKEVSTDYTFSIAGATGGELTVNDSTSVIGGDLVDTTGASFTVNDITCCKYQNQHTDYKYRKSVC